MTSDNSGFPIIYSCFCYSDSCLIYFTLPVQLKLWFNFETTNFKNNIIFFESVFIDKVGSFVDIQNGNFINEDFNEHTNYFNKKSKIINGIKLFIKDANKIKYKLENSIFVDNNFNLMCKKGFIKNEKLFDIFLHDNYYVRNCVKKINRR